VTVCPAPNFAYDYLVKVAQFGLPDGLDLSRWRLAYNGAEPVHRRTIEAFTRTFEPCGLQPGAMTSCYGLAEATLMVTMGRHESVPRSLAVDRFSLDVGSSAVRAVSDDADEVRSVVSVGEAAPGVSVRIALDDGPDGATRPAGPGIVGEVQVSGPSVMSGYIGVPADDQPFTSDGWLRTGDLAFHDGGEFFIVGRLKDTFVVRGQNYYAEDVEELVRNAAGISAFRCAALRIDEGDTESMVVVLETTLEADAAARLARKIEAEVAVQLAVDSVRVLPVAPRSIPVTTSGKVQRHTTRLQYEQQLSMHTHRGETDPGGGPQQ
jgi:acyl-CoA synthetase (AMP-forming)/AMP-acid ligase II